MLLETQWDLQLGIGSGLFFDLNFRVAIDEMLPNEDKEWAGVLLKVAILVASSSCLHRQEKDEGFFHTRMALRGGGDAGDIARCCRINYNYGLLLAPTEFTQPLSSIRISVSQSGQDLSQ